MSTKLFPTIFFGHGSPMNAIEQNKFTRNWQQILAGQPKPKAILSISAHWETNDVRVTNNCHPKTIHDFGGFPQALFNVNYPCRGSKELANRVAALVGAQPTDEWGLDHGTWSILTHVFPAADVPVVQLSINTNLTFQQHYDLAKRLAPLRQEGVLVMGSGSILHNLYGVNPTTEAPLTFSFHNAIAKAVIDGDHNTIINAKSLPGFKLSSPTDEHFVPLLYVLALQRKEDKVSLVNHEYFPSLTMTCVKIE